MSKKEEKNLELSQQEKEIINRDNPTGFKVIVREFKKDKLATFSLIVFLSIIAFVVIGSFILDKEKVMTVDILKSFLYPGEEGFVLGTDQAGRSLFGQLVIGARNSIIVGVSVTIITNFIGITVGLIIGYYGGIVDNIIMRIIDFIQVLPRLMLIIIFVTIVPSYNIITFIFIMSILFWTGAARLVRSKALSEGRRDYISASKTMGTPAWKIMVGGILPNISSIIIVDFILVLAGNIGIETGLTFLGFGFPQGTPSLGTLVNYALDPLILKDRAYIWLPASILILILMLSINYIGRAFRRAADAKQRLG